MNTLSIASYNIHKARGLDRRTDLARIAAVLAEIDADLVGVQEIYSEQVDELADRLGMHGLLGVTHLRAEGAYGNAILTRLPVRNHHVFDLTWAHREPRGGVRADVLVDDVEVHLFNVHFGLRIRERADQVERLVRQYVLHDELSGPRVVMGDLNEWFPGGAVGRALRRQLHGPRIRRTHPSPLPLFALDRIYWDRTLHGRFRVHRSRLARVASDHLPIVARLQLPAPAAAPLV